MNDTIMAANFLLATLALSVSPGPDMAYILAQSFSRGKKTGLFAAVGTSLGAITHVVVAAHGLAFLIGSWPTVLTAVKAGGAVYLVCLAAGSLRDSGGPPTPAKGDLSRHSLVGGLVISLTNPKTALFMLAFLPQFIDDLDPLYQAKFMALGLFVVFSGSLIEILLIHLSGNRRVMEFLGKSPFALRLTTAVIFVTIAIHLLIPK